MSVFFSAELIRGTLLDYISIIYRDHKEINPWEILPAYMDPQNIEIGPRHNDGGNSYIIIKNLEKVILDYNKNNESSITKNSELVDALSSECRRNLSNLTDSILSQNYQNIQRECKFGYFAVCIFTILTIILIALFC